MKAELHLAAIAAVPQTKRLGGEAVVDFGEFYTVLAGERLRVWMFVMRLSASGKTFRKAYVHQCGESFFCQPGQEGAHEKGGVEGEIGRFRRNQLVPLPAVDTIDELNERE